VSPPAARPRISILGIGVDAVSIAEAVDTLARFAASGRFHHAVTVNPEFIMAARADAAFAAVLNGADLAVPDGVGLLWAARRQGTPLPERVAGVDVVERLAEEAARRGLRLFLLGAQPGVAAEAGAVLSRRYPGLNIVGAFAGSPALAEESAIVERVQAAQPHVLFVAYGAPQQDVWIARNRRRLPVGLALGVGGAFDFISGRAQRAPQWMRRWGLEWLHRLLRQPWRWRRMLALPRFVLAVLRGSRGHAGSR
jgi:N-acetylglucosaminyldiphosphoundecaprenol N-acetyl-beta-D-mannosaminyltransferase